jgi:hypothetical protein
LHAFVDGLEAGPDRIAIKFFQCFSDAKRISGVDAAVGMRLAGF